MINFFKKTRKQLADDNKPLKYARYALGEILLVVIGIFIALQLNTWKENKKKSDLGYSYLIEMRHEVEQDVIKLDGYIKRLNESTKDHEAALNTKSITKLPLDSLFMIIIATNLDFEINELTHDK